MKYFEIPQFSRRCCKRYLRIQEALNSKKSMIFLSSTYKEAIYTRKSYQDLFTNLNIRFKVVKSKNLIKLKNGSEFVFKAADAIISVE